MSNKQCRGTELPVWLLFYYSQTIQQNIYIIYTLYSKTHATRSTVVMVLIFLFLLAAKTHQFLELSLIKIIIGTIWKFYCFRLFVFSVSKRCKIAKTVHSKLFARILRPLERYDTYMPPKKFPPPPPSLVAPLDV